MCTTYYPILLAALPILLGIVGCVPLQQYRSTQSDDGICDVNDADRKCGTDMVQRIKTDEGNMFQLGFIEFDDQGQLWDRDKQKQHVVETIAKLGETQDLIMVVFVHGWKHSAAPNDGNIDTFRSVLSDLTDAEVAMSNLKGVEPSKVFGVYLGWRGESVSIPVLDNLTFWDRKNTAHKVGYGGVTEVLSELESIRDRQPDKHRDGSRTKLAVIGHSFGGAVVFSALVQVLENRMIASKRGADEQRIKGFGDIVVLINPAFEAMRYTPLADMSTEVEKYDDQQLPILAILTSEADYATKYAFKIGRYFSTIFEMNRVITRRNATTKSTEQVSEKQASVTAVGHFSNYQTHTLKPITGQEQRIFNTPKINIDVRVQYLLDASDAWHNDKPGGEIQFGQVLLHRSQFSAAHNPYLLAYVDKHLIADHNDIADDRIIEFIKQLIMLSSHTKQEVEDTRRKFMMRREIK